MADHSDFLGNRLIYFPGMIVFALLFLLSMEQDRVLWMESEVESESAVEIEVQFVSESEVESEVESESAVEIEVQVGSVTESESYLTAIPSKKQAPCSQKPEEELQV